MCLMSVAEMFASITKWVINNVVIKIVCLMISLFSQLELVYCYTILEQNKRLSLLVSQTPEPLTSGTDSVTNSHLLDTFFPFDPYLLRRLV